MITYRANQPRTDGTRSRNSRATAAKPNWQQRKRSEIRTLILEAAIDCIIAAGYHGASSEEIAKCASISRGAMLHHYATKKELVSSAIDYIVYRRTHILGEALTGATDRVAQAEGLTELFWQTLRTREHAAFLELRLAARYDSELSQMLEPKARQYDEMERQTLLALFPDWAARPVEFALAVDFYVATLSGLTLNRDSWSEDDRKIQLCNLAAATISMLKRGELTLSPTSVNGRVL